MLERHERGEFTVRQREVETSSVDDGLMYFLIISLALIVDYHLECMRERRESRAARRYAVDAKIAIRGAIAYQLRINSARDSC